MSCVASSLLASPPPLTVFFVVAPALLDTVITSLCTNFFPRTEKKLVLQSAAHLTSGGTYLVALPGYIICTLKRSSGPDRGGFTYRPDGPGRRWALNERGCRWLPRDQPVCLEFPRHLVPNCICAPRGPDRDCFTYRSGSVCRWLLSPDRHSRL